MNIKKLSLGVLSVSFSLLLIFTFTTKTVNAGTADLSGWAWSSNIGWVSFNCTDTNSCGTSPYKVTVATSTGSDIGTLSGYAWSTNIGWIKFAGDGTSAHPNPEVNLITGAVTGDIRACAGTVNNDCTGADRADGWDGWARLSDNTSPYYQTSRPDGSGGITYIPKSGTFVGAGWGGENIGWFSFMTNIAPGVKCNTCGSAPTNLTAVCQFNPSVFTIPSSGATTYITPSVGTFTGGTAPYTFSPSVFTVGEGANQARFVTVKDSSVPQKSEVVWCNPVTVQVAPLTSGLRMWLKPAALTAPDNQDLAAIKVKVGEDVKLNWQSSGAILNACEGYLNGSAVAGVSAKPAGAYLTLSSLTKGVYKYKMSCINTANSLDIDAEAPNSSDHLLITVGESKVVEQ
jgi:hypothetical protein